MTTKDEALNLAREALEFNCLTSEDGEDLTPAKIKKAITAIRAALARKSEALTSEASEQPAPPPECKTDAEKTAFAFGWWKALEENRKQPAQDREPAYQYLLEQNMQLTAELAKFRAVSAQALEALEPMENSRDDTAIQRAITDLREALMSVPDGAQSRSDEEQPAHPSKPLTDEEIKRLKPISADFVSFRAGVRCVEREYGIGAKR